MDPLSGSSWSKPSTVAGFTQSPPNATLVRFVEEQVRRSPGLRVIDVGCGAGRNAIPLAELGCEVLGTDLSWPMARAALERAHAAHLTARLQVVLAPMDVLPVRTRSFDVVVAHGIWNLARSAREFRRAVCEAARVARPGAGLFVFTFSRHTLAPDEEPVAGEPFVFTQFSGEPQCFLTEDQLTTELGNVGFVPDPRVPLTEHNRRPPGALPTPRTPVIYEAAFRLKP